MATRKQFGFAEDDVVIGFVGRFSPGKGHEDLLHAAASLRDDGLTFRVLVTGEASYGEERYEDSIREMCRSLGLGAIVIFAGFRSDIPHVMGSFDILAFPSHAESFGLVLIEAMAMELPVVSTNCDGVLDIVVDGGTGLYVHPRNPTELAAALKRLIRDPLLRAKMGKAGRQRVLQLFDQTKQIDTLENLYSALLKHPGSLSSG
jgi:glycosyltransferase involved in cell wall biosynthesis